MFTTRYIILFTVLMFGLTGCYKSQEDELKQDFDFVVLADTAYTIPDDYPAYYGLIKRINQLSPAFSLHLGDTKSGGSDCGNEAQQQIKADFKKFAHPLIYTPGDNEWRDCALEQAGGYAPLERLEYIRQTFFAPDTHLGLQSMIVLTQQPPGLAENKMWKKSDVVFSTLHIIGSNNGLPPGKDGEQVELLHEYQMRNQANMDWLADTFAYAKSSKAKAVVLAFHGGMFPVLAEPDGFADMRRLIQQYGSAFGKPVLLVHGDHHSFIIDRPYGYSAPNIIRLQTFGAPESKAVKVHVEPSTPEVFSYAPVY